MSEQQIKNVDYYMGLRWFYQVVPCEGNGDCYMAFSDELQHVSADGETPIEALTKLEPLMKEHFATRIRRVNILLRVAYQRL